MGLLIAPVQIMVGSNELNTVKLLQSKPDYCRVTIEKSQLFYFYFSDHRTSSLPLSSKLFLTKWLGIWSGHSLL